MRRAIGSGIGAIALMFALAAAADPAPVAAEKTPRIQVNGTFKVNGGFTVAKPLTAGTTVSASIYMQTSDTSYSDNSGIQAQAKVSGGKVRFSVTLPYAWLVAKTADTVTVTVSLNGGAFTSGNSYSYTTYLTKTIPLPKNGATTTVNFTGSL